jgi:hypothetical protein
LFEHFCSDENGLLLAQKKVNDNRSTATVTLDTVFAFSPIAGFVIPFE